MDIDQGRLDAIYSLCCRYAKETRAQLLFERTLDRSESLQDADFVVNTAMAYPPGYHVVQEGWAIAKRHGYRFGDSHHIMEDGFWLDHYQFRLFDSLATEILDTCPGAWYVQLANPVLQGITYLTRTYPRLRCVGLCHGHRGVLRLAKVLGLDPAEIEYEVPGVNHFVWLTEFKHRGEDAYPLLNLWLEEEAPAYWRDCRFSDGLGKVPFDLYRRFGIFPIGDTCTPGGGSWPWWYHTDSKTERKWNVDPEKWWKGYFAGGERKIREIRSLAADTGRRVSEYLPPGRTGELIVPLMESISLDIPRVLQTNIGNSGGYVPGVPPDFEVEIPTEVDGGGIRGTAARALPRAVLAFLLRDRVAPVEVEIEAYLEGSRDRLRDLIMMDPWTRTLTQAEALLGDIMAMPYHEEMREHYS
jgi:alpha-galactosidase